LSGLVKKYQVPVELLRLEITESAFSHDTAKIVDVVKKLIDLGFTVEIDDFGSGYSSLNTLKDVPAQIIKLDMKFMESSELSSRGAIS
jgi:EAL domain-containing protein (putative c-di-GMP-specific phosphodiesterase class I)